MLRERVPFDLRAIDDIAALCQRLGPIDVLVNNAAMLTRAAVRQYSPKDRRDLIATNIEAPAELIRCLVPLMIAGNGDPVRGRVINIASVAGFWRAPGRLVRAPAKGAIPNMTKSLAKLYGPQGVLINAVAPGPTKTAMFDQLPQSRIDEFNRLVFARRFAEPDEIAKVIEWLALDAPEYVNGAHRRGRAVATCAGAVTGGRACGVQARLFVIASASPRAAGRQTVPASG